MRFDSTRLEDYGFSAHNGKHTMSASFMDGDFCAELTVDQGILTGIVIDVMNDEEYARFRNPDHNGPYVSTVRDAYERLLLDIAEKCCDEIPEGRQGVINDELIMRVLSVADAVPYGCVSTYGQIAKLIGMEKNARMVGRILSMADRYGDHPCHRVVSSSGRTVPGWAEQRELLEGEGVSFRRNGHVDMKKHLWMPDADEAQDRADVHAAAMLSRPDDGQ